MEEKLIIAVSAHPVLYDTSLFVYRDVLKKNTAWKKVSEIVGIAGGFILMLCNFMLKRKGNSEVNVSTVSAAYWLAFLLFSVLHNASCYTIAGFFYNI